MTDSSVDNPSPSGPTSGAEQPITEPGPEERRFDQTLFRRDLDEVQLLIDFVSGRPDKNLSRLEMPDPQDRNKKLFADNVVRRIAGMRYAAPGTSPKADDVSFLLLAKDHLSTLAAPARGVTIAYTAMFVSGGWLACFRQASSRLWRALPPLLKLPPSRHAGNGDRQRDSYFQLAIRAFPSLRPRAARHSFIYFGYWYICLAFIFITAWTYWDLALGNSIIERLHVIEKEHAKFLQEHPGTETKCARFAAAGTLPNAMEAEGIEGSKKTTFRCAAARQSLSAGCHHATAMCPRQPVPHPSRPCVAPPAPVGDAIALCQRLQEFDGSKARAHNDLLQLISCEGAACSPPLHVLQWLDGALPAALLPGERRSVTNISSQLIGNDGKDIDAADRSIESVLSVYSAYVLPLMFGILGTMVGAIRETRDKIRGGELAPRDLWMLFSRP